MELGRQCGSLWGLVSVVIVYAGGNEEELLHFFLLVHLLASSFRTNSRQILLTIAIIKINW